MPQLSLYHAEASPPCRTVRMLAHTIGLDLQLVDVDMLQEEHRKPEFVKMNPQHQVPVLGDNGFYLSESRAIIGYLVDNYAEDDSLYPRDPKRRATVNRMLFFDAGTLWMSYSDYQMPIFYGQPGDPEKEKKLMAAFETFDKLLDGKEWATGSHVTIADYALAVTTSSAEWSGVDLKAYSNVCRWLDRVKKAIPCFDEINNSSFAALKELLQKLTEKLAQMSLNKQ
ncbi:glutathione S-transferase 1-1-like [Schistocerca americana]|uniref:glutathione S-transferase 1-1-like n=1 Tax=Schistocerca americana TaxID=7009 RepID=UPI001F4FAA65|nr:glutathione S-transferase 1-1-like [Schistocerca americana]